jgi:hypothetical protein
MNIYFQRFFAFLCLIIATGAFILLNFLRHSIEGGKKIIKNAYSKNVLSNYIPKTGDILMMHYLSHGMIGIPVAEHWPTHAAMIWVKRDGSVFVVECTKFSAPLLPNVLKHTLQKKRGIRIVPWKDYANAVDDVMYIRRLIKGYITSEEVERQIEDMGPKLDFETRIADSMTIDLTIAIGFVPVWPKFSEWCAKAAKLNEIERRKNQAFCSEFVALLIHRLGGIDPQFKTFYQVSPASFLKSAKFFDKLTEKSPRGFQWGEDEMIIKRY